MDVSAVFGAIAHIIATILQWGITGLIVLFVLILCIRVLFCNPLYANKDFCGYE